MSIMFTHCLRNFHPSLKIWIRFNFLHFFCIRSKHFETCFDNSEPRYKRTSKSRMASDKSIHFVSQHKALYRSLHTEFTEIIGLLFKGVIGCKNSLFKLFEHKCVLEVCVHIHPIMIKIHPVFFFLNPCFKIPFLKSGYSEIPVRMT